MNQTLQAHSGDLAEWGTVGSGRWGAIDSLWLALVLGMPVLLVGILLTLFVGILAALGAVAVLVAALVAWIAFQPASALKEARAHPLEEEDAPRLFNVARGRAGDLGMACPSLWVVDGGGPNALVGRAKGPVLAITRDGLDSYTRTELEAVVTHCLLRLEPALLRRGALSRALSEVSGPAGALDLEEVDTRTAALTRYPLGLAAAVEKAEPRSGRGAGLWFVPGGPRLSGQDARAALLRDL